MPVPSSFPDRAMPSRYNDLTHDELVRLLEARDRRDSTRFGLIWEANEIDRDKAVNSDFVALDLIPRTKCGDGTLAESYHRGDNFDALRYLRMTHAGQVKCLWLRLRLKMPACASQQKRTPTLFGNITKGGKRFALSHANEENNQRQQTRRRPPRPQYADCGAARPDPVCPSYGGQHDQHPASVDELRDWPPHRGARAEGREAGGVWSRVAEGAFGAAEGNSFATLRDSQPDCWTNLPGSADPGTD